MTKVMCERQDCKHCVDGECSQSRISVAERTIPPEEEIAACTTYEMASGVC